MNTACIRTVRLPDDKPAILSFIDGMQHFEHALEPDRRVDPTVAEEFLADISARVTERSGAMLIAEDGGSAAGWAVVYRETNEIYVASEERDFAFISELYVAENVRGRGIGKALIAACEEWARVRKLSVIMIGVLGGNAQADAIYREAGYRTYYVQLRKYLR